MDTSGTSCGCPWAGVVSQNISGGRPCIGSSKRAIGFNSPCAVWRPSSWPPRSAISVTLKRTLSRWSESRLPTEFEWESFAADLPVEGDLAERQEWRPSAAADENDLQFFGGVWQWTSSAYGPYPGFRARPGALGEYNGKFMCNQYVLRGGSCATSQSHLRVTYRNFFPPEARWQFSGLRLARDVR